MGGGTSFGKTWRNFAVKSMLEIDIVGIEKSECTFDPNTISVDTACILQHNAPIY